MAAILTTVVPALLILSLQPGPAELFGNGARHGGENPVIQIP